MSSSVRSWRQMVTDADPDFMRESLRPVVYEFSNGRKFRQRNPVYGLPTDYLNVLTIDGEALTIDGQTLTMHDVIPFTLDVSGLDGVETLV